MERNRKLALIRAGWSEDEITKEGNKKDMPNYEKKATKKQEMSLNAGFVFWALSVPMMAILTFPFVFPAELIAVVCFGFAASWLFLLMNLRT